jgi:hypothetical protein
MKAEIDLSNFLRVRGPADALQKVIMFWALSDTGPSTPHYNIPMSDSCWRLLKGEIRTSNSWQLFTTSSAKQTVR